MPQVQYKSGHLLTAADRKRHVQTLAREREQRQRRATAAADEARIEEAARKRRALREQAAAARRELRRRTQPVRIVLVFSVLFFTGLGGLYLVDVARSMF
jgi:hypothetical protein